MCATGEKVKVGIIGVAGIAGAHYRGYDSPEGKEIGEIYAMCDVNEKALSATAEQKGVPPERCFTDLGKMLALDELDAVDVCTPNQFHHPQTVAAARAGKHVLVEKPMAVSGALAQEMVDECEKAGVILQVGCNRHFEPAHEAIKRFIDAGEFGEIYHARACYPRRRGIPGGSFIRKETAGLGALADIGVHALDLVLWLCGYPKPTVASGVALTKIGTRPGYVNLTSWAQPFAPEDMDVEEFAAALIRFETGLQVILEVSWAANIDTFGPSYILGTDAGCTLGPYRIFTERHGTAITIDPQTPEKVSSHGREVVAFMRAIRGEGPNLVPGSDVVVTSHVFDAIYESTKTGREVKVKTR